MNPECVCGYPIGSRGYPCDNCGGIITDYRPQTSSVIQPTTCDAYIQADNGHAGVQVVHCGLHPSQHTGDRHLFQSADRADTIVWTDMSIVALAGKFDHPPWSVGNITIGRMETLPNPQTIADDLTALIEELDSGLGS